MPQILVGPLLSPKAQILWSNAVKALISKFLFERIQRVLHDKPLDWTNRLGSTHLLASLWSSQSKYFVDYSI